MYHGVSNNSEMIALVFGVIVWIIRGILKGIKQVKRPIAPVQRMPQAPPPSQTLPPQTLPARAVPLVPAGDLRRQPQAGGPAVPSPATSRSFRRQEQEAAASEPSALNMPLQSPALSLVRQNSLFSGTDDLVRAIILQEVLGPPLSRRTPPPVPPPSSPR